MCSVLSLRANDTFFPSLRANKTSAAIYNNGTTNDMDCHESASLRFADFTPPLAPSAREGEQKANSLAREGAFIWCSFAREGGIYGLPRGF